MRGWLRGPIRVSPGSATLMMTQPELVAGQGFFDTRVMEAAPGAVLAKMGAEGVQGLALLSAAAPRSGAVGCCVKVEDGSERPIPVMAAAFLRAWGAPTAAAAAEEHARVVTYGRGAPVGDRMSGALGG